jgi:uncharacterized protein
MLKAVIHVNVGDPETQGSGLKNVENVLNEVGSDAKIEIVAHGAGIVLLVQGESKHAEQILSLIERKVRFVACRNSLRDKAIAEDRLLPGVQVTASGAVEVLRKQQEGFAYFKPSTRRGPASLHVGRGLGAHSHGYDATRFSDGHRRMRPGRDFLGEWLPTGPVAHQRHPRASDCVAWLERKPEGPAESPISAARSFL